MKKNPSIKRTIAPARTWTDVGKAIRLSRQAIERAISSLKWKRYPVRLGVTSGMAIETAIRSLKLPKVSHIAESIKIAPLGLYGIRAHYANGMAQAYIADRGTDLVVIATDFWPKVKSKAIKRNPPRKNKSFDADSMSSKEIDIAIWDAAEAAAQDWYRRQIKDTYAAMYLYYRPKTMAFWIGEEPPSKEWILGHGQRVSPAWNKTQVTAWVREQARRLPIL